jgi:hypothetical protein
MKDIVVIYPRGNKPLIKRLISKVESDGISCWVAPRDFKQEEKDAIVSIIQQSKLLILIIDKTATSNGELRLALTTALENKIEIVPFVVEKVESNLYTDFFLNKLNWIDAYEDSFENAYELLIETYHDLTGEKKTIRKKAPVKSQSQTKIKPLTLVIAAIVVITIAFFVYRAVNVDENTDLLVGQWMISDYQDNLPGHNQDSLIMIRNFLKASGKLVFNEDHSFERRGFSKEPQVGKWELNSDKTILYLEPISSKQKDIVNIEKLTKNELVIYVEEKLGNNKVTTKIFFTKQAE